MARYYRRRYRTIVRAPKKKWASNIQQEIIQTTGTATKQYGVKTLVQNSSELSSPTPVILKTGNIKIQGDYRVLASTTQGHTDVSLYVMFVPQGFGITEAAAAEAIVSNHPEWIMAWKYLGVNQVSSTKVENCDSFSFSSRLKRNLNSGDTIQLICIARGYDMTGVSVNYAAQYWTCAN